MGRKTRIWVIVWIILGLTIVTWKVVRVNSTVNCSSYQQKDSSRLYEEKDRVMKAISLSYLVYGCEECDDLSGSVSELLSNNKMGIVVENFGIKRKDEASPDSAFLNTAAFIDREAGELRYLTALKDEKSGFYGAAFCDDKKKCIWIAYSGTVSFNDAVSSGLLVLGPGLSSQERSAFLLYERIMESSEVTDQGYSVILTGHSLGGALAAMVSRMSGCYAVAINGACGVAIDKINDIVGEAPDHYHVVNYMTSPKNGRASLMDMVQRLMYLGSYDQIEHYIYPQNEFTKDAHCAFSFIEFKDGNIEEPIIQQHG